MIFMQDECVERASIYLQVSVRHIIRIDFFVVLLVVYMKHEGFCVW